MPSKLAQFLEIGRETRDGFERSELGEFQCEGVVEQRHARAAGLGEEGGQGRGDGRGKELGLEQAGVGKRKAERGKRKGRSLAQTAAQPAAELRDQGPALAAFGPGGRLGEVGDFPCFQGAPDALMGIPSHGQRRSANGERGMQRLAPRVGCRCAPGSGWCA
jgi:hypothetical protein